MANVKQGNLTKPPQWWKHLDWAKRIFWKRERKAALCDGAGPAVMSKSAPETNTSEGHVHVANMTKTARNGFIFAAKGAGLALPEGKYKLYIVKEGQ